MAEQQRAAPVVTGIVAAIVTVVVLAGASWLAYPAIDKRIDEKIAALDARLTGEIAAASAKSRQPGAAARLDGDLAAVNKELAAIKTTLAQQSQGAAANGKLDQALASLSRLDAITQSLGALNTQLAAIKTAAGDAGANRDVLAAVKSNVDGLKADIATIKGEIGGLGSALAALKTDLTAVKTAAAARADLVKDAGVMTTASTPQGRDLTIVSITRTAEVPAHPVAPLNVYFNRVGARDDKGQTEAIVQRLKEAIKGRSDCTIAVTGHADTLGNDDFNLALSKARAEEVAAKLKTAFAGDHVTITETGRGERALETWTPDNTPRKTNRRVEIDVTCKS